MQSGRVFLKGREKPFERSVFVAMVEGAGPHAKFLHVVAHGSHLLGMRARRFLGIGDDLLDSAERYEIAKNFLSGDDANGLAVIFRYAARDQSVGPPSRAAEADIIQIPVSTV